MRPERLLVAANALACRIEHGASRDNGNAAMPKIEQMLGRVTHAFSVVGHHRIRPARQVAINQHDWNIQPTEEGIELFRNRRERPDNNSVRSEEHTSELQSLRHL